MTSRSFIPFCFVLAACASADAPPEPTAPDAPSTIPRDPAGAYGPKTCIPGYVWREAFEGDVTCVTPQRRDEVREENGLAASRRVGG